MRVIARMAVLCALAAATMLGTLVPAGASTLDAAPYVQPDAPVISGATSDEDTRKWFCVPGTDLTDLGCITWAGKCWSMGGITVPVVGWGFNVCLSRGPDWPAPVDVP